MSKYWQRSTKYIDLYFKINFNSVSYLLRYNSVVWPCRLIWGNKCNLVINLTQIWKPSIPINLVKQSLYRPVVGNVVSFMHRPPLPPRKYSCYSLLLQAESTPGPVCGRNNYVSEKFQWQQRESNSRPSGLQHWASTNCVTACPSKFINTLFLPYILVLGCDNSRSGDNEPAWWSHLERSKGPMQKPRAPITQ